jgi:tetratricopeptide (TPR) repeat protein
MRFRFSNFCFHLTGVLAALSLAGAAGAQSTDASRQSRIDVDHYTIDADVNLKTQSLTAKATMKFTPLDDRTQYAIFELNGSLNVSKVTDDKGTPVSFSRSNQDNTVRLTFDPALAKGKAVTLVFTYDGHLTGSEDSPVYGIKFAAIHDDYAYLLYPARWFPVSGYTADRFSADLNLTVPSGSRAIASGIETSTPAGDKTTYSFQFSRASFPGSIAVVTGTPIKSNADGITTTLYFHASEHDMAGSYGEEIAKIMNYFTGLFGIAPYANLTVIETENGAPGGYAAPGILFLNPAAIGHSVNPRLLANQISRQWWEQELSPVNRNHLWLENGLANYSEALWTEHEKGAAAFEAQMKDEATAALTVDNVPIIQSAREEDYSPELWALTGSKGAVVMNMLRYIVGDEKFYAALKQYVQEHAWQSVTTADMRTIFEKASAQDLRGFFIQWIESSGAPEFKLEYTVFRTQKGFRVTGKISQDLDTFRMPVDIKIETEGNPEKQRVDVVGTSTEFSIDTFGKPKAVSIDPDNHVLRYSPDIRVAVAIRRGMQFAEISEFSEALREYQKALETQRNNSLAHYRIAEVYFLQNNYQSAANEFREALNGNLEPKWVEVWSHIRLGQIFDISGQRDRAVNEYQQAQRTRDNTQGAQDEIQNYLRKPYERKKTEV